MYQELLGIERKLDWTMTRKKVEVQDALAKTPTVREVLRLQMFYVRLTRSLPDYSNTTHILESHGVWASVATKRYCGRGRW